MSFCFVVFQMTLHLREIFAPVVFRTPADTHNESHDHFFLISQRSSCETPVFQPDCVLSVSVLARGILPTQHSSKRACGSIKKARRKCERMQQQKKSEFCLKCRISIKNGERNLNQHAIALLTKLPFVVPLTTILLWVSSLGFIYRPNPNCATATFCTKTSDPSFDSTYRCRW